MIFAFKEKLWILCIVKAPIPDQGPIGNLYGIAISIKLGSKFRSNGDWIFIGLEPLVPWHMYWF